LGIPTLRPLAIAALALGLCAQRASAEPGEGGLRPACVAADTCTLVRTVSTADGVETVTLVERPAAHADATRAYAGWMAWPHAPANVRTHVFHGGSVHIERPTESGAFLLRTVPRVRLADEPDALLVLVTVDPLRPGTPAVLPEAIAIAQERKLLSPEQESRTAKESQAQRARTSALTEAWAAFVRAPTERATRNRLVSALGGDVSGLDPASFLTPAQRAELRRAGLALEGQILLEDAPGEGIAYRLRVEAVPLEQVAREWNAGLRALVNPLERVPRPQLLVAPGHRYEEVSFTLDVKTGDEDRMSQVVRRLLAVPGLSTDGKKLPAPAL
jgi:hypothetical protein